MKQSHQQLYEQGGAGNHGSQSLGAGAALQALKMFSGGGSGQGGMGGGGGGQSQMIGLAMSEASKLFDQQSSQGNVASGTDKQSVVNTAAKMALKSVSSLSNPIPAQGFLADPNLSRMYMKNQGGGMGGGAGGGGLMNLASKFFS